MKRNIISTISAEEIQQNQEVVVDFKGPLGADITQALQEALNKDALLGKDSTAPGKSDIALESQAMDAMGAGLVAPGGVAQDDDAADVTAYVVKKEDVTDDDLVEVTKGADQPEEDGEFVLIINGTGEGDNSPNDKTPELEKVELASSLEALANKLGVQVFDSVGAFMKTYKRKR